jgi:hypothetical protein
MLMIPPDDARDRRYFEEGVLEAQRFAVMALWHLASLGKNRTLIESAKGIRPLITMLSAEGSSRDCH